VLVPQYNDCLESRVSPSRSVTSIRLIAMLAASALVTACGASDEVKQAVSEQHAAALRAAAPGGAGPAAAALPPASAPDSSAAAPAAAAPAAGTTTAAAPVAGAATGTTAAATGKAGPAKTTAAAGTPAAATAKSSAVTATGAAGSKPAAGVVACGAAAPAAGNGGATDTGVTATSIRIGATFFNGGFLDKYSQVSQNAASAYFDYINGQGGVCGRKIVYTPCDTAGTADGTSGCLTKLADQDKVFMMGPSLDFNLDIVQKSLEQHKLPWVGSSGLYDAEFSSPWMFPTQIPGGSVGALIATHTVQTLGLKKIGVSQLRNGAGPSCTGRLTKTAEGLGGKVVATALNSDVETSLDSEVASLKNAGVEAVLFCNDPVNTVKFIQAAQRIGWHPAFVGGFVAADDVPKAAGAYGKGMYGLTMFDFYGSDSPGLREYKKITEFYYPRTFHHFYEQAAYVGAAAIVAVLKAIGPNVNRIDFVKQLKTMRAFDIGLGLKLDFADLKDAVPSGIMLKADDNLNWTVVSKRFSPPGSQMVTPSAGIARADMVTDLPRKRVVAARAF
jgi:ABC-type branched-subunit amino acid transport system substrate-binding protein